jgi:hypothetical protein
MKITDGSGVPDKYENNLELKFFVDYEKITL